MSATQPIDYAEAAMPMFYPVWRKGLYALAADYQFEIDGKTHRIPRGFQFDGWSIPRFFWRIMTPFAPDVIRAALVHDWLYRRGALLHITRKRADRALKELLIEDGVPSLVAASSHRAVRLFGAGLYQEAA